MRKAFLSFVLLSLLFGGSVYSEETIEWWQFWTDPAVKPTIESMIDEFEQANPGITVNLTDLTWSNGHEKIAIAFASGSGPDVVELGSDWIAQFAANGHLADFTEHVASDSADYDGWGMATYEGAIYGRPWFLGTRVLYVNRDLTSRARLGDNFSPLSWIDLHIGARAVHALGKEIYGWGSNTPERHRLYKKYMPFFWSNRGRVFTPKGGYCVVSSTHAIQALQSYKALHDSCGFVSNQRGIEDAFLDGKVGFIISGDWLLKRIELESRDINFATTLVPGSGAGGKLFPGKSFQGGEFLTVNAASSKQEAARSLIEFITSPKNQLRFCKANHSANPSSRIAQKDEYFQSDPNLQTFILQIKHSVHPPVDPDWVYIEEELEKAVERTVFGNTKAATSLLTAQRSISKLKDK